MADQSDYTVPDAFFPPLRSVEYDHDGSSEKELIFLDDSWTAYYNRQSSGTPSCFTAIFNGPQLVIRLLPAPSTVKQINIRCARLPDKMTIDSQSCDLPTVAHDAMIHFAVYRAWNKWEEHNNAEIARREYESAMRDLLRGQSPMRSYPLAVVEIPTPLPRSEMPT